MTDSRYYYYSYTPCSRLHVFAASHFRKPTYNPNPTWQRNIKNISVCAAISFVYCNMVDCLAGSELPSSSDALARQAQTAAFGKSVCKHRCITSLEARKPTSRRFWAPPTCEFATRTIAICATRVASHFDGIVEYTLKQLSSGVTITTRKS